MKLYKLCIIYYYKEIAITTKLKMIKINGRIFNTDIKELDLSCNQLTQLPKEIGQLTQLINLVLSNNKLSHLPTEIGNLTRLTELYLYSNKLTQLPIEIGNLTRLTYLTLSHNQLTQLPSEIGNLAQLTQLYLYDNPLKQLPSEIGNLTQLTHLYLFDNRLTKLPTEIGNLTQLTQLYLNNNQLTQLPREIGNLTQLAELDLYNNQLTQLPTEIGNLMQLTTLVLRGNPIENTLNPIIQRFLQRIKNKRNQKTIYSDIQNVHSSSIQQSIKTSIHALMNYYNPEHVLTYLDWNELHQKTKEIITEYMDCKEVHTMLDITFKELFIAILIEMDKLSRDIQKEIRQRLNEEMQESECKCFTGRISRLVNCLSGYSDKVKIQISESEEIGNIISVIMEKRELKTTETLKEEVNVALKERGYEETTINVWLEYIE